MSRIAVIAVLILACSIDANADTATFSCNYVFYNDVEGRHAVKSEFKLTFVIDRENGKAYMVGNNGSSEVEVVFNSDGITFVEITGTGNVMTTTITKNNATVHSRNSIMFGDLLASQYFGTCLAS